MSRFTYLLAGVAASAVIAVPAMARDRSVHPYIQVSQVLDAPIKGGGDVLTYTSVAAGIDASYHTSRIEVQANYQYEHRFSYDSNSGDDDVHSGLIRASARVLPVLTIEAGGLATRARADIRGGVAAPGTLNGSNIAQVFSGYVGPTLAMQEGPLSISGAYRFGYTKVGSPDGATAPAGQPPLDNYDSATNHMAMLSVGTRAGAVLPIGLTASVGWNREEASQLNQRFDGKYGRVDAVLPISPTLALTGGAGYEKITASQRDPLVDAGGLPVRDGNGRYVTDPASPQRIAYETDGLYWDAGVIYRPSRRTTLEARVGRRYNSMTYVGSLSYEIGAGTGVQIGVYDSVDSFGRGLTSAVASLPTSFNTRIDPFASQFSGCVFGTEGSAAGGCLNPMLGAIATAQFRSRGVTGVFAANAGPYHYGFGGGYQQREFLVPGASPGLNLAGSTDRLYFAQAYLGRSLSRHSSVDANLFFNYFDSGQAGAPNVTTGGGTASYSYSFGRFGANLSGGIFATDSGTDTTVSAQGALGMRYSF